MNIDHISPVIQRDLPPPLAPDELSRMAQVDHQWKEHTMYSIDLFLETLYMQKDIDPGYILLNQADYRELAHLIWQGTNYRGISFEDSLRHPMTRWINQTTGNLMKISIDEMLSPDTIRFFYEVHHVE